MVPSGMKVRKDEEEKLVEIFLVRYQKSQELQFLKFFRFLVNERNDGKSYNTFNITGQKCKGYEFKEMDNYIIFCELPLCLR